MATRILLFSNVRQDNYYHFLVDVLPSIDTVVQKLPAGQVEVIGFRRGRDAHQEGCLGKHEEILRFLYDDNILTPPETRQFAILKLLYWKLPAFSARQAIDGLINRPTSPLLCTLGTRKARALYIPLNLIFVLWLIVVNTIINLSWSFLCVDAAVFQCSPDHRDLNNLRSRFHARLRLPQLTRQKMLVYSQRCAQVRDPNIADGNPHVRFLSNDTELCDELRKLSRSLGYDFAIHNGRENFRAQVQLASNAAVWVGLHGAGLANALFMREGSLLLELAGANYCPSHFKQMSHELKLNHYLYTVRLKQGTSTNIHANSQCYEVNAHDLALALVANMRAAALLL
jgi:hypothetical protein